MNNPTQSHLNWLLISKSALAHNYQTLAKSLPGVCLAPVLKSNAYGHGLELVAPIIDGFGPERLMVDSWEEAEKLRGLSLSTPIVIMGHAHNTHLTNSKLPFEIFVSDISTARLLAKHQPLAGVHLFVDTGMHREGLSLAELEQLVNEWPKLKLKLVGLASHLATADESSSRGQTFASQQEQVFDRACDLVLESGLKPTYYHLSASAGARRGYGLSRHYPGKKLVRLGLSSYGLLPMAHPLSSHLQPALSLYSTIVELKTIARGESVGYGLTFTAQQKHRLALLPIGYFEGFDRRLSNVGVVRVGDELCPVVGRISMNMSVVDVSQVKNVKIGDQVEVFSAQEGAPNSLGNAAKLANTIPYELLVKLGFDLPRILVE